MNDDEHQAPLPPHNRSWRHPSEIAQHERQRTFVGAPPLNRSIAFVASLCAVAVALVILGLSLPMSPRSESIATPSDRPTASVRSTVRIYDQATNTSAHYADDGRVFTPVRISSDTEVQKWQQFTTGTLFVGLSNSGDEPGPTEVTSLRDFNNETIPVSLVARDSPSNLVLYFSPWTTTAIPSLFTPQRTSPDDLVAGRRVSLLAQASISATIGLRSTQLNDTTFVPLDVGLATGTLAQGTPVVNSRKNLIGLFTERNYASGFVPLNDAWILVAPTSPTPLPTTGS